MSRENVEIVRRGNEAYARGDLATMLGDIDAEMITYREEPDGATFHGPDGLLKAIAEWVEDFDEFTFSQSSSSTPTTTRCLRSTLRSGSGRGLVNPLKG